VHPMDVIDADWTEGDPIADPPLRFMPLQAQEGDYALFLHKAAVEITFEKKSYLIVPNSAVLVLVREGFDAPEPEAWGGNSN
jgi:chaperonin GroES